MNITFGIPTIEENNYRIPTIIESILEQNIPNYEIIIVGGVDSYVNYKNINHIPFDESQRPSWITKKKNIIAQNAKYDIIVIFHDYYKFDHKWYEGYLKFGTDWDVCSNICYDIDNDRYYDWVAWDHPNYNRYSIIPDINDNKYQYVPGHYFLVQKRIIIETPLNEDLIWGQSEDIEWTYRLRQKNFCYKFNPYSSVKHIKKFRGYENKGA